MSKSELLSFQQQALPPGFVSETLSGRPGGAEAKKKLDYLN